MCEDGCMHWQGELLHINVAPHASAPIQALSEARLLAGIGIEGDRYATRLGTYSRKHHIDRQATLIEVEALEALGIDPVHYLIVPRVIGMAVGVFALTVYLIIGALASGCLFAFLQDVPLTPGDYFKQIAEALGCLDFALLALKTIAFGFFIAIVTCYHGLAQPLRLEDVSRVAVRAVSQGVIVCVLIDALFIVLYLVT